MTATALVPDSLTRFTSDGGGDYASVLQQPGDSLAAAPVYYVVPGAANPDPTQELIHRAPILTYQRSLKDLVHEDFVILPPVVAEPPEPPVLLTQMIGLPRRPLPEVPIEKRQLDWIVAIVVLVFGLFASVRLFFGKYLLQMLHASVNYTTASRLFRERSISLTHAGFRLDVIFYLVTGLFLYQLVGDQFQLPIDIPFLKYLLLLSATFVYFGLRKLLYATQGKLSQTSGETQELLYNMDLYNRIFGVALIPIVLIIGFSRLKNIEVMVIAGGVMAAASYILLLLRGLKILMKKDFPLFYLILYLCTLEILPLVFIYKLVLI